MGTATDVSAILVDTATTIPALIETQSQIVERTAATGASQSTDFIFNAGTRISCSSGCENAGKTIQVWLEIQEI